MNNEVKVSVLFKPSRQSKINADLTYLGYYEYSYERFMKTPINEIQYINKVKIDGCKFEDVGDLYDYCRKNIKQGVVIIMCPITELFE